MKTQTTGGRLCVYAFIVWVLLFALFLAGMASTEPTENQEEPVEKTVTLEPILNELNPTLNEMSTGLLEKSETEKDVSTEEPAPRYVLTDTERDIVERVVMAEAGGECFEGQMLVAQCILNAAEKLEVSPSEAVVKYKYCKARPEPTQSVKDAVAAVFDAGEEIISEPILYFYAPARVTSEWHESQVFVIECGGHRFFAERSTEK